MPRAATVRCASFRAGLTHSNYRMAFLWTAAISACAIFPMILVIRGWKHHGGHDNYVAPLPENKL